MAKLSKRKIDGLPASASDQFIWDAELPGFGLRVKASGAKSFLVQYRNRAGRSRRLTLGRYGVLTVDEARKEARLALANVSKGDDPAEARKLERGAMTMKELCEEYLEKAKAGLILTRQGIAKSPTTIYTDSGRIERHIVPLMGRRTVKEPTTADVRRLMQDIIAGKTKADLKTKPRGRAIVSGGKGAAARTVGLLGGIFSYAVQEGYRTDNPVRGIIRPKGSKRDWRLDDVGYRTLGKQLRAAEQNGEHWQAILTTRAIALTGCRRGEIERLRRTEVDSASGALRIGNTVGAMKTGKSIRPIGDAAIEVLKDAMSRSTSKFVFPAIHDEKKHYSGLPKDLVSIVDGALPGITPNGLRHSFASTAEDLGFTLPTIGALIGHAGGGSVTAGYVHKIDSALLVAANRITQHIAIAMTGKSSAKVVKLSTTQTNRRG